MNTVCIDTHILIWGVKGEAKPEQRGMIGKALNFLDHLDENNVKVIVPSIVVGELLMPVPDQEQDRVTRQIERDFIIVPYDFVAAKHYARIWQEKKDLNVLEEIKSKYNVTRTELKADAMIVATAVARKVDCIYSNDKKLHRFAEGFVAAREMPDIARQAQLSFSTKE